jgi:hypothetical protein
MLDVGVGAIAGVERTEQDGEEPGSLAGRGLTDSSPGPASRAERPWACVALGCQDSNLD